MERVTARRAAAFAGGVVATAALLVGPASSVAVDVGQTASSLASGSGAGEQANAPATTTRSRRAKSEPVSATVQGTNPHGQGTALAVSLGGKEAVVVGRSRGEQRGDGSYHGHTTTLALFGNDVIANDTGPGQTAKGPVAPLQEQVLDQICKGSSGNICVDVLRADSATTANGSANHSRLAGVTLGGSSGVVAVAGDSNGNIERNGDCQKAHGDVTLVKLMLGGNPLLDLGESASDSNACPSGTTVTNSTNPLLAIGGQQVPLPGCGANSPGNLVDASPLVTIACNAGAATGTGGVVNDALAGTVLAGASANGPAGTLSGAGTGAAATTSPGQGVLGVSNRGTSGAGTGGGATGDDGDDGSSTDDGNGGRGSKTPASALAPRALSDDKADKLPYTGSDVVLALFIASCLIAAGFGLRGLAAPVQRR